jgi:protein gp37
MGRNSKIGWTDHTLNFWVGCQPVSVGCLNCYAARGMKRFRKDPAVLTKTGESCWRDPLRKGVNKWMSGEAVFVCSWSDFFHHTADKWRAAAWDVIQQRPDLNWLILTKRSILMMDSSIPKWVYDAKNIWFGVSVENCEARLRIENLRAMEFRNTFLSIEPMLEPIELKSYLAGISTVIVGGETGPQARPLCGDWVRNVRDECYEAGVPFYLKDWGHNATCDGERIQGRLLDGLEHNELAWR